MSCLYILKINPLSVVSFVIIFSHSEGCLFTLLIVSFAVQKLLSLIISHLFTSVFISITLGGGSLRILLWFMSSRVLPMFSSKSFIVSGLTLRSVTHFEFTFVYGVRKHFNFILLHVAIQFSQHHLLKRLSYPIVYSCLLCQKQGTHRCMGLFLGFVSCSVGLYFCCCVRPLLPWRL